MRETTATKLPEREESEECSLDELCLFVIRIEGWKVYPTGMRLGGWPMTAMPYLEDEDEELDSE